jgi:hypothetical protein
MRKAGADPKVVADSMPVIQVAENERAKLQSDCVYVIPPDRK